MKIYRHNDFLKLPEGTIFCFYIDEQYIGNTDHICIKGISLKDQAGEYIDFCYIDFIDTSTAIDSGDHMYEFNDMLINGSSYELEPHAQRQGLYDEKSVYLVYEKNDVLEIIKYLQTAIGVKNETNA